MLNAVFFHIFVLQEHPKVNSNELASKSVGQSRSAFPSLDRFAMKPRKLLLL